MNRQRPIRLSNETGFSLIEVIIGLMVSAMVGVMLFSFSDSSMQKSTEQVGQFRDEINLQRVMEEITSEYKKQLDDHKDKTSFISQFKLAVETTYPSLLVSSKTGFVTFTRGNSNVYTGSTPSALPGTGAMLQITLKDGDQTIKSLFAE